MEKTVLVAMSGGVDSSVAAALLLEHGYRVHGVTMTMMPGGGTPQGATDARAVADRLGFPHTVVDVSGLFEREVLADFVQEYGRGRTPNPCVRCNRYVKFGYLMDTARELGCAMLATGHYAVIRDGLLMRGADRRKDQSYFLYRLYSVDLSAVLFPLGALTKDTVRDRARHLGLPNASKGESQDICFIPDGGYGTFLAARGIVSTGGPIVDESGATVGRHTGITNYTVGQRKGLGSLGRPMFVKQLRPERNEVVVADDRDLFSTRVVVGDAVFGRLPLDPVREYAAQVRYRSRATACRCVRTGQTSFEISFINPVRAVAPGQSAVVYDGDTVVAGGIIESPDPPASGQ